MRSRSNLHPVCYAAFLLLLLLAISVPLHAQSSTATITGTITDLAGAIIPGVKVSVHDPTTGFEQDTVMNDTGNYNLPGLWPARHDITIELTRFRAIKTPAFNVEVDQTAHSDYQMEAGLATEVAEVAATGQLLESEIQFALNVIF